MQFKACWPRGVSPSTVTPQGSQIRAAAQLLQLPTASDVVVAVPSVCPLSSSSISAKKNSAPYVPACLINAETNRVVCKKKKQTKRTAAFRSHSVYLTPSFASIQRRRTTFSLTYCFARERVFFFFASEASVIVFCIFA